jgi:dGTPase
LEYLIKLVKTVLISKTLETKEDRISYLRALAIESNQRCRESFFVENEELILQGKFPYALMDKSKYKAQMDDIIKISVENPSKSWK